MKGPEWPIVQSDVTVTRDLTAEEIRQLGDHAWATRTLELRQRLVHSLQVDDHPSQDLVAEAQATAAELRLIASKADPQQVAQIGRLRGAIMGYVVELRRRRLSKTRDV